MDAPDDTKKVRLKPPPSGGSGMYKTGAAVTCVVILLAWCTSSDLAPSASDPQVSANEVIDATKAIERVNALTSAPSSVDTSPVKPPVAWSVGEVAFDIDVAAGWAVERQPRQVFLKERDAIGRVCQIVGDPKFDLLAFMPEIDGKEAAFEANYIEQAFAAGAKMIGGTPDIRADARLIRSSREGGGLTYTVASNVTMKSGARSKTWLNVIGLAARQGAMVRIQCSNLNGQSDADGAMQSMANSLRVL